MMIQKKINFLSKTKRLPEFLISVAVIGLIGVQSAEAKSWIDDTTQTDRTRTDVIKDDTVVLRTDTIFSEVRVSNPKIADVVVLSDKSFQILGKSGGKTNVMLYDTDRRLVDIVDVVVGFDTVELKRTLFETFPNEPIEVRALAGGIYLSGDVGTQAVADRATAIAQAYAPDRVTSGLAVRDSHQVMLQVRFVEASRNVIKQLGINVLASRSGNNGLDPEYFGLSGGRRLSDSVGSAVFGGTIGKAALDVQIEALEEKGVIRTLAEPNLVSMSGETASFLAGGEFPVPVPSGLGEISIEYRQFGVGLAFTPTVLDDGIINLKVVPEVSQLDRSTSVTIGGVDVPGLRVRRADTTIELRNSQSFAIAGLLQTENGHNRDQVPWLGDIPILGSLFSSTRYRESETELVIIVTPYLAQPVSDMSQLATPLDGVDVPGDAKAFLMGNIDGGFGHALQ